MIKRGNLALRYRLAGVLRQDAGLRLCCPNLQLIYHLVSHSWIITSMRGRVKREIEISSSITTFSKIDREKAGNLGVSFDKIGA